MPDTLNLKKDVAGNTVVVETTTTVTETPLSADTIREQIRRQAEVMANLQSQLDAIEKFEKSSKAEATPTLATPATPVVDQAVLADIVAPLEAKETV